MSIQSLKLTEKNFLPVKKGNHPPVYIEQYNELLDVFRNGAESIAVAGTEQAITYAKPYLTAPTTLVVNAVKADGNLIGAIVTNRTIFGFTVKTSQPCTLNYIAIL